ncbi:hypothetical protein SAMD00023353_4000720 [Rosellinia necatrix]|uniref:Uncharacterized protein n=1 Tax=Rosellinia necatrix TaxID=77044 RepID=A0A1S8A9C4_ROSNE|nr:hypothetical protein SAMD00023353_4000720 [Rosellinia necatrix]
MGKCARKDAEAPSGPSSLAQLRTSATPLSDHCIQNVNAADFNYGQRRVICTFHGKPSTPDPEPGVPITSTGLL